MQAQPIPSGIPSTELTERKPDESGGIYFSSSIRISDPDTKEILVEIRGEQ